MKNLRKVLALVLAFACTFTMFASAVVFEDVPAGSEFSEAITMLSDLKIIQGKDDGKYHPEDTITRAEACALIARMLTGDPNVNQYVGAANFSDVQKGSWKDSAIGYCVTNGIAVGVGNGKFEPDRPITDAEFVTLLVRAMGYETPGMSYPYGHMSAAQANGLLDGTSMQVGTDALRGEDAQALYNAMFADYAKGAKTINTTHGSTIETYPTIAESVWGLSRAAIGTYSEDKDSNSDAQLKNCKSHTWVIAGPSKDKEDAFLAYAIKDDSKDLFNVGDANDLENAKKASYDVFEFKYDGDISGLIGYRVELWGEGTHGSPTWEKTKENGKYVYSDDWKVKAIKTVKGQTFYDYNASMADSKSDNGEIVLEDKTLGLGQAADNAKNIQQADVNAELAVYLSDKFNDVTIKDDKSVEKALNTRDGAQYKLMDWDSDGTIDWVVVDEASYYKVESVSSKRVTVTSMKDETDSKKKWDVSTDEMKQTWKLGEDNDTNTKDVVVNYEVPEGLKEGDIVEVTYKFDGKANKIKATATVIDAESKSLDKVSTKGGLELTFDDEVIYVAENTNHGDVIVPANPGIYKDFNSEEFGVDFDLYRDRNGFIVYSDYTTERAAYAMVLDAADGSDTVSNRKLAKVDILTGDNKHLKDVEIVENANIDSKFYDNRRVYENQLVGNVFKYWTNEDGQITRMVPMIDTTATSGIAKDTEYTYKADSDRLTDSDNRYVASLEDAKVIFAVKPSDKNAAGKNLTNKGYIEVVDENNDGKPDDFYVDVDNVLAVKQKDIADIGGTADTKTTLLDAKAAQHSPIFKRIPTWLGENEVETQDGTNIPGGSANDPGEKNDYLNKFVAAIDKNGDASAAVLGVDNFNKFGAGTTKIGLVTDVAYANSSDGKYVEVTAAFDGENKTISSMKKVDFDDIVSVYDASAKKDFAVGSETSTINNGLFNGNSLDKALEDNAAYAEIKTDADGNLVSVTFLDQDTTNGNMNKLVGHYFSVSRNVTLGASEKNMSWLLNDNSSKSAEGENEYLAIQNYFSDNKLFSLNKLPKDNGAINADTKFYEIDGRPTLKSKNYAGTQMSVVNGFESEPTITAGLDYTVVGSSNVDNINNNQDNYDVADIVVQNNGDIAAVYAFTKSLGEVEATNLAVVSTTDANGQATTTFTAGDKVKVTAIVADAGTNKLANQLFVYDANGNDVTSQFNVKILTGAGTRAITGEVTIGLGVPAGQYTIKAAYNGNVYQNGGCKIDVKASNAKYQVNKIAMAEYSAGNWSHTNNQFKPLADNKTFGIYVGGEVKSRATENPITTLQPSDLKIQLQAKDQVIENLENKGNGYYYVTLKDVDFSNTTGMTLSVALNPTSGMVVAPSNGLSALTVTAEDGQTATGGIPNAGSGNVVEGVGNVAKVIIDESGYDTAANGSSPLTTIELDAKAADDAGVQNLSKDDFKVTVNGQPATSLTVSGGSGDGNYTLTPTVAGVTDLRGTTVTVTVNNVTATSTIPAMKQSITAATPELNAIKGEAFNSGNTSAITLKNVQDGDVKVFAGTTTSDWNSEDTTSDESNGLTATYATGTLTITGTPTDVQDTVFTVGISDAVKATVTVKVGKGQIETISDVTWTLADTDPSDATITVKGDVGTLSVEVKDSTNKPVNGLASVDSSAGQKVKFDKAAAKKLAAGDYTVTVSGTDAAAPVTFKFKVQPMASLAISAAAWDDSQDKLTLTVADLTGYDAIIKELKDASWAAKSDGSSMWNGKTNLQTVVDSVSGTSIVLKITCDEDDVTSGSGNLADSLTIPTSTTSVTSITESSVTIS